MGEYNPTAPQILGQEWVPIRDEGVTFSPAVNVVELGHQFTLAESRTLTTGRYYINTPPPSYNTNQVYSIAVYPAGEEAQTGPVRRVVIPCNAGTVTGTFVEGTSNIPLSLATPGDWNWISARPDDDVSSKSLRLYFATNSYAPQLNGKRILGVNLLHVLTWDPISSSGEIAPTDVTLLSSQQLLLRPSGIAANFSTEYYRSYYPGGPRVLALSPQVGKRPSQATEVTRVRLGENTLYWGSPISTTSSEALPWRYSDLQKFESTAGVSRLAIEYGFGGSSDWAGTFYLSYAALEVLYCEETRVAVGGVSYNGWGLATYVDGANLVTMRDAAAHTASPVLAAGEYTAVVSAPDVGDISGGTASGGTRRASANTYPTLNGLRELYQIPPHPGVQVNVTQTEGEAFTREETAVLPQLSLHTSAGPLTEVHVYGRQAVAQVYGSITATQDIDDGAAGAAYDYPWVRFYARRWGDTTVDLTLDSPSIPGSSVTITPTEHDALDEIIDGWKEVTLYFDTPPSMGTGTRPQWRWSATGESAGNRWEILGATAPALSGVPSNAMNLIPSPNQLSIATYGQPASGAAVNLGWIPQYAPAVTATADDETSDAVILFAQELPAITGLSVTEATQEVVGIGLDCGLDPCCIPTGIMYNAITWSTITVDPTSAFGYYEIQRMDTVDTTWATVMKGTSITGASFSDYEARVGLESSYRIRAVDSYEFPGAWSDTVTITPTAPGITGGCVADGHVLIFTSNERQDGDINLAYASVWEGRVAEDFEFPESNFVQLQAMYDRDFFTAFRPTERGGEQFTRTVLVQAAAISAPTLGDFRSLLDMAWDSTSYICVRDEDGNRWFATVLVPGGRVTFNRRLYMAEVRVIEVTDTPSPADPWS